MTYFGYQSLTRLQHDTTLLSCNIALQFQEDYLDLNQKLKSVVLYRDFYNRKVSKNAKDFKLGKLKMWKYETHKIMYETEKLSQVLWFVFSG